MNCHTVVTRATRKCVREVYVCLQMLKVMVWMSNKKGTVVAFSSIFLVIVDNASVMVSGTYLRL